MSVIGAVQPTSYIGAVQTALTIPTYDQLLDESGDGGAYFPLDEATTTTEAINRSGANGVFTPTSDTKAGYTDFSASDYLTGTDLTIDYDSTSFRMRFTVHLTGADQVLFTQGNREPYTAYVDPSGVLQIGVRASGGGVETEPTVTLIENEYVDITVDIQATGDSIVLTDNIIGGTHSGTYSRSIHDSYAIGSAFRIGIYESSFSPATDLVIHYLSVAHSGDLVYEWNFAIHPTDDLIGSNDLVATGTPTYQPQVDTFDPSIATTDGLAPNSDSAIAFDGSDDYVAATAPAALQSSSTFTVSFWASSSAFTTADAAISLSDGGAAAEALTIYPFDDTNGNGPSVLFNNTLIIDNDSEPVAADGTAHHFAFVSRSATDHELYVDGVSAGTSTTSKTLDSGLDTLNIGAQAAAAANFAGVVDELVVVNRALSWDEIVVLRDDKPRRSSTYAQLKSESILHVPCNDNTGTNVTNLVGTDLTATNMDLADPWDVGYGALDFDGVDGVIDCGDILDAPAAFTLSVWFKGAALVTGGIFCRWDGDGYMLYAVGGVIRLYSDSVIPATTTTAITDGTWKHLVGSYDGTTARLYVDGILVDSGAADAPSSNARSLNIGAYTVASDPVTGHLKDARIYSRALTPVEILSLYGTSQAAATLQTIPDCVGAWPLEEQTGTTHYDVIGGNHGTASGGVTYDAAAAAPYSIALDNGHSFFGGYTDVDTSNYLKGASVITVNTTSTLVHLKFLVGANGVNQAFMAQGWVAPFQIYLSGSNTVVVQAKDQFDGSVTNVLTPAISEGTYVDVSIDIQWASDQIVTTCHNIPSLDNTLAADLKDAPVVSGNFYLGRYQSSGYDMVNARLDYASVTLDGTLTHEWDLLNGLSDRVGSNDMAITGSPSYETSLIPRDESSISYDVWSNALTRPTPRVTPGLHTSTGTAIRLDGDDQSIQGPAVGLGDVDQSISAWVKTTDVSAYIFSTRDDSSGGLSMYIDANGDLQAVIGTTAETTTGEQINDDESHHVVLSYDATADTVYSYIDGTLVDTLTPTTGTFTAGETVVIGARGDTLPATAEEFAGIVDEVMYFEKTLTATEVQYLASPVATEAIGLSMAEILVLMSARMAR